MTPSRKRIIQRLSTEEARQAFVEAHIDEGLAFQIRETRKKRGWKQIELAARAKMAQTAVSRLENPNYGKYSVKTLKRLAAALDVALIIRFAPFSELITWVDEMTPDHLGVASFEEDARLFDNSCEDGREEKYVQAAGIIRLDVYPAGRSYFYAIGNHVAHTLSEIPQETVLQARG